MVDVAAYIAAGAEAPSPAFELGFQGSFYGVSADPPAQPAARLDKGGISRQTDSADDGEQLTLWGGEDQKRELRGHHALLTRLLGEMENGQHGLVAGGVADKWASTVRRCPGVRRKHGPCGKDSFEPHRCDFALCPWCQRRRANRYRKSLGRLLESGLLGEPMFITFSPPNIAELTKPGIQALGKAVTQLRKRKAFEQVKGGVRSLEVTYRGHVGKGWNLHCHALVDSPWMAQYPQTDIKRQSGRWVVVKTHPGLAPEFTAVCQNFAELKSPRLDFDLDNPDHWYFVDLKRANSSVVPEIAKYLTKGSDIVAAGAEPVMTFLAAVKGVRMLQPWGSLYDVEVDSKHGGLTLDGDDDGELPDPEFKGHCPNPNCPEPSAMEWEFVSGGVPDGVGLKLDRKTGLYRIVEGPGPPG